MINKDLLSLAQPVDTMVPMPGNPRRGDIDAVAASLQRFGQRKPIVARSVDRVVIAGNHTLAAAVKLGWTDIAVSFVEDSEQESIAYSLADNRISDLGSYDEVDLFSLVGALEDFVGTGYDSQDFADLLKMSELRQINAGGLGDEYTNNLFHSDGVTPSRGLQNLKNDYINNAVRSVILSYSLEEYEEVITLLAEARRQTGFESNSEAILAMLRLQ